MLRQVLINLLGNAVKYTRTTRTGHIEIGSHDFHREGSVIFIRDNGVGFDMKYVQ